MNAIAFDTHALVKELTAAGFTEGQAEAVTGAVRRTREADLSTLATKTDIALLKTDIALLKSDLEQKASKADVSSIKADLLQWVIGAIGFQTVVVVGAIAAFAKLLH